MKLFTPQILKDTINKAIVLVAVTLLFQITAISQTRNYGLVYSENLRGDVQLFGNTLMSLNFYNSANVNVAGMNDNSATGNSTFTNGFQDMRYIDIDGNAEAGATTRNSSSSDLTLPIGVNAIKLARLYWGGRVSIGDFNLSTPANRTIKLRKGTTGAYDEYQALQIDQSISGTGAVTDSSFYQAYTDVTNFVRANGAGTYTVGNAPLTQGIGGNQGNYGGWCMVVIYENPLLNYNSVRLYDGFQRVGVFGNPVSSTVNLSGLDFPSGALSLSDARMGMVTWEGDANFKRDFLKINDTLFSNTINPIDNPMNGTISIDGVHVSTKNPNYTNQFGIDIDQFNVGTGYGILPGATSVKLEFGTEQDQYFPGLFSFVAKMKDPALQLVKTVVDASGNGTIEAGEVLTYTLKGKNIGVGNANNIVLTDTLPSSITFVPNSLQVIYSPGVAAGAQTDASADDNGEFILNGSVQTVRFRLGNTSGAVNGGFLSTLDSFEVQFQATVNAPAPGTDLSPIINVARLRGNSDALINYIDDGTASINPAILIVTPVILKSFTATLVSNNLVKASWVTTMELNFDKYELERSSDGRIFNRATTIQGGGNVFTERSYSFNDDVTAITSTVVYYRLVAIDLDGQKSYSKVVSVRLKKGSSNFTISPNPFSSYVNINIDWNKTENTIVKVYSMNGKELVSKSVAMIKGTNYVVIDELGSMPAGNYLIQFNTVEGRVFKQITKQ